MSVIKRLHAILYTDKKENKNFPNIWGNSDRIGCKVIYEEELPNIQYEEMHKYFYHI